jgi:hypothetical protein
MGVYGKKWEMLTFWHFWQSILYVTGRPKKTVLTPVFNVSRKRWILDIPGHISGKRDRKAFKSQSEALEAAAKIAQGVEIGIPYVPPVTSKSSTIDRLAAAFIADLVEQVANDQCSKDNLTTLRWGITRLV